ncbi:sensor domain-containing diguanylate cyclase [Aquipseudomonas guryensis]|jgi:diguanylate cyclase (GGDEF)-like protein|uniref:Diguanylate cyclase n=1 Tax=Aquipseudomonas guryensis TaxID=2759165 RepID=A0A7W4DEW6_9GAMM|nr:diguanylate cyclase [Pseudomonas guryensis]MBB1521314.1 diguanylate cyclase [Pseudomonas guryensis]
MQSLSSIRAPESANDELFDGLARLARQHVGVMSALVIAGAEDRPRIRTCAGAALDNAVSLGHLEAPWHCPDALFVVPDVQCDERLRDLDLLAVAPDVRFLAACPLRAPAGEVLGILFLLHDQPRELNMAQQQVLHELAQLAAQLLAREAADADWQRELDLLRENERRMALAITGSGTGIWDRNVATGEIHYSTGWKALLGYAEHEVGNRIEESYTRVHPADLSYVQASIQAHFEQHTEAYEVEHRLLCRNGSYKWVCSRGKVVERDAAGQPLRMIGTTTDISAMRLLSEQVQQTADLMTDLTNEIPGMAFQYQRQADGRSFFTYASSGVRTIYGLSAEQLLANPDLLLEIIHPDDRAFYLSSLTISATNLTPWHLEYRVQLPQQGTFWRQGDACPRRLEDGSVLWHGFIADITEHKLIEAELQEFATTDFLTQLCNRRSFMLQLETELSRVQRTAGHCATLLMFDLDHFKDINDRWGHFVGDQALRHFAAILSAQLRKTDAAGRMGGEEFAVLLSDTDIVQAMSFGERIRSELESSPLLHAGEQIPLAVSVGIAAIHAGDLTPEAALSRSDIALYRAKRSGRNRIECHSEAAH